MCNRYMPGERNRIEKLFGAEPARAFNAGPEIVHPRDPAPVVRLDAQGRRVIESMGWGFPVVLKGKRGQPLKPRAVNNARFDKLGTFWRRWAANPAQRCLIPATRFAEAVGEPGRMTQTWLGVAGAPMFAWAGLWDDSDAWGRVFTGVMTDAALPLIDIHDRCPVILPPEDWDAWLGAPLPDLARFDRPWPAEAMTIEATDQPWHQGRAPAQPRLL